MSSPEINQVLAQMRVLTAQAQNQQPAAEAGSTDFGALLKQSIDTVNETQMKAGEMKRALEVGSPDVDLAEVMIAVQKSSVSFQAMVQVRNKLLEAYREVMSMPI